MIPNIARAEDILCPSYKSVQGQEVLLGENNVSRQMKGKSSGNKPVGSNVPNSKPMGVNSSLALTNITYCIKQLCASLNPSLTSHRKTTEDIEHMHRLPEWTRWHWVILVPLHYKPWKRQWRTLRSGKKKQSWLGPWDDQDSVRTSSIPHPTNRRNIIFQLLT